jgi:hypothetical protein
MRPVEVVGKAVGKGVANCGANRCPTASCQPVPIGANRLANCGANRCQPVARSLLPTANPPPYRGGWQLAGLNLPTLKKGGGDGRPQMAGA